MTQEDKQLLLKDLCARLPYGVVLDTGTQLRSIDNLTQIISGFGTDKKIENTKYYLRPISSMTKEEENEFISLNAVPSPCPLPNHTRMSWYSNATMLDWLNENHFDYRGLIEKGLALEAPKNMYKQE